MGSALPQVLRRAYLRRRYPTEASGSWEQAIVDGLWDQTVRAINSLSDPVRINLDTNAIGGVFPIHSSASARAMAIRRFPDGSSQLLVSQQFMSITLLLSTLARFKLSRPVLRLAGIFGAPTVMVEAPPDQAAKVARAAIMRDLLIQLNFHGIAAYYRPQITPTSSMLWRLAVGFAMAHEAAHLLIGDRDTYGPQDRIHLRSDGTIAESQWGPELAQDRLALRLSRSVTPSQTPGANRRSRLTSAVLNDRVLSSVFISLAALHALDAKYLMGESTSHGSSLDRLGSIMIEFNPLASPNAIRYIDRLLPVVDTCFFLEPLPVEAWELLAALVRAHIIISGENRRSAISQIKGNEASDVVLTARAEYEHTYDYLVSVQDTEVANREAIDLLRTHRRRALPSVLDLLGVPRDSVLENSPQLTRLDLTRIINSSHRIKLPSGIERDTYVDTWANVIAATMRDIPDRNRMFYQLLDFDEG